MASSSYLYRRPSGIYVVRLFVPKRLKLQFSRSEIHVSTGSRDLKTAKLLAFDVLRSWQLRFLEMSDVDVIAIKQGMPMLAVGEFVSAATAAKQFGIEVADLVRLLKSRRAVFHADLPPLQSLLVDDVLKLHFDVPEQMYDITNLSSLSSKQVVSGIKVIHKPELLLPSLLLDGTAGWSHFEPVGAPFSVYFTDKPADLMLESLLIASADLERLRVAIAGSVSDEQVRAAGAAVERLAGGLGGNVDREWSGKRFSDLLHAYTQAALAGKCKDEHKARIQSQCGIFTDLMSDPFLKDINPRTIDDFKAQLASLPANLQAAKRRYGAVGKKELAMLSAEESGPRQSEKNISLILSRLRAVFAWAKTKWIMSADPMDGYDLRVPEREKTQKQRELFTDEELLSIFSAPWFKVGHGERTIQGTYREFQPHYYWLPLLGLLTGGRINELSQLYLRDIRETAEGTWYFDFNLEGEDKVDGDDPDLASDKSLKTVNAVRTVPLHPLLIQLDLLGYIARLKEAGYQRLFPELKHDARKGYGKAAGKWFNDRYLGKKLQIERNGKKTFHSLRHHFATSLDHAGLQESLVCQLMGHARGDSESTKRYRKDRLPEQLREAIAAICYPFPKIAPFEPDEGLCAVRDALQRKH